MRTASSRDGRPRRVIVSRTTSAIVLGGAILVGTVRPACARAPAAGIDEVSLSIHYRARADRALADVMADLLGVFDYRVAAKRLAAESDGGGEIRYFRTVDRKAAFYVQSIVESVLAIKGRPKKVTVVHRPARRGRVRPGRIEIWVPSASEQSKNRVGEGAPRRRRGSRRTPPESAHPHGRTLPLEPQDSACVPCRAVA